MRRRIGWLESGVRVVVLFVGRPKPLLFHVERYVKAQWPHLIRPRVTTHREGYFIVKCFNAEDANTMLGGGPYSMGGHLILILILILIGTR